MLTSGMSGTARFIFSMSAFWVAISTCNKGRCATGRATLYKGSFDAQAPLFYALAFIFQFMIIGFTGLILGTLATDIQLRDTNFVASCAHVISDERITQAIDFSNHTNNVKIFTRHLKLLTERSKVQPLLQSCLLP